MNKVVQAKSKKFGRNLLEDTTELDRLPSKLEKKSSDINNITHLFPNYDVNMEYKNDLLDYQKLREIAAEAIKEPLELEKEKPKEK